MARVHYTLPDAIKRSIKGKTLSSIDMDAYTNKAVDAMLVKLLGVPGVSGGKAQESLNSQIQNGSSPSAYSSAQNPIGSPEVGTQKNASGSLSWFGAAAGLIEDVLGYVYADYAAKTAYERQNEYYDNHLSMPAKVQEYQDAGLNPMGLAGAGVGTTSAPSVAQANAPAAGAVTDVLGALLGYKSKMAQIEVDKERVAAQKEDIASRIEYRAEQRIYQQKVNEWFDAHQIVDINKTIADTNKALEEINTEKTKQALNEAGISELEARSALEFQQALQKEFENSPEYRSNTLALQRARANADNANAAHLYEDIKNLASQRDEITSRIALNYASTDIGKQQLKNLGLTEKQIQFAVDHQKGDLVFQRINQVTSSLKDIGVAAAGITSAASGGLSIATQLTPRPRIGFN